MIMMIILFISEEFQKKVFNPFERDENIENFHVQGTGLGLSISKNLVEKMHGKISVNSVPKKDNAELSEITFTVLLPIVMIEEQARLKCNQ